MNEEGNGEDGVDADEALELISHIEVGHLVCLTSADGIKIYLLRISEHDYDELLLAGEQEE